MFSRSFKSCQQSIYLFIISLEKLCDCDSVAMPLFLTYTSYQNIYLLSTYLQYKMSTKWISCHSILGQD